MQGASQPCANPPTYSTSGHAPSPAPLPCLSTRLSEWHGHCVLFPHVGSLAFPLCLQLVGPDKPKHLASPHDSPSENPRCLGRFSYSSFVLAHHPRPCPPWRSATVYVELTSSSFLVSTFSLLVNMGNDCCMLRASGPRSPLWVPSVVMAVALVPWFPGHSWAFDGSSVPRNGTSAPGLMQCRLGR